MEGRAVPSLSPLASPSATRAVLEAHGLATKKALGQNFLVNDAVLQKIVVLADLRSEDAVLEVGPGIGTLTIALLKCAGSVVSVERDADLPAVLAETCAPWASRFALIGKDALALSEEDVRAALVSLACAGESLSEHGAAHVGASTQACDFEKHPEADFCASRVEASAPASSGAGSSAIRLPNKFVANLPYAVAATLVLDYFERFSWLESATIMVQKEVADRMMARPGTKDYGAFTVKLSLFARPSGRFPVGPNNFFPPPRVDSAVLRLDRCELCDEEGTPVTPEVKRAAAIMADAAFANRRKTIANSCKTYFAGKGAGRGALHVADALADIFDQAGIDPKRRGETLSTQEFVRLGKAYLGCF